MEIYLSYSELDLQTAVHLKEDLEAHSSLVVALENEDWEDVEDFEFEEQLHQAEVLLNLETETSNITAWLIDEDKPISRGKSKPTDVSCAPTIKITNSCYDEACIETFLGLITKQLDRRYPLHLSEEEHDSDVDYENNPRQVSKQGSKRSLDSISRGDSDQALMEQETRRRRRVEPDILPTQHHETLRDLFANSKIESRLTLNRTEALKARRQNHGNRKVCLRGARGQ